MHGWMKLNIDGSFAENDGRTGIGMILRDSSGNPVFSACCSIKHGRSALEAEILAFKEGITKALQWTLLPLVVETDCVAVVTLMSAKEDDRSHMVFTVMEARRIMTGNREVKVCKIHRSQNRVSHELANYARIHDCSLFWRDNSCNFISRLVMEDCAPD